MGFLSLFSSLLLVTGALGAPPQNPKSAQKKTPTPGIKTGPGHPTQMDKDTQILLGLRKFIKDDPHGTLHKWDGTEVCNWYGIKCAKTPMGFHAVAVIDFNNFGFGGPEFTPEYLLANLPYLTAFHVQHNNFLNGIPDDLSNNHYFFELDMASNLLHGPFPKGVLTAKQLTYVDLSDNNLDGPIPREVYELDLDVLYLDHNGFTGTIAKELTNHASIYVSLSDNKLEGPIPSKLNKNLLRIFFQNNRLSGPLPEVKNLIDLEAIDFSTNKLSGSIPESYGQLPNVIGLNFTLNQLTGTLPKFHTPNLELFDAAFNELTGTVPESLCASPKMVGIDLKNNRLTGKLGPACMKLYNDKEKWIDVHGNCIENVSGQKPGCGLPGGKDDKNIARPQGLGTKETTKTRSKGSDTKKTKKF